jgi:hypothetical protein
MLHEQFLRLPNKRGQKVNGLSRAKIYEVAQVHPKIFHKVDGVTLIDLAQLNDVIATYPVGALPGRRKASAA